MLQQYSPRPVSRAVTDRALGAFIGLAVGDALGATLEFAPCDPLRFHSEMIGGGPFNIRPGEWTDDTAMALALADTILDEGGFTPKGFMSRLADWLRYGEFSCQDHCIDVGRTTFNAIQRLIETDDPVCPEVTFGGSGNGGLIRLAPVALRHLRDGDEAVRVARLQSSCTHPARMAADAAAYLVTLLRELILGVPNASLPRQLHSDTNREIAAIAAGNYLTLRRLSPKGYVADTLETALWALHHTESFEQALIAATSLGGDAHSIGAVTGMLAGASYGLRAIPDRWLLPLAWRDEIAAIGERLLELAVGTAG